MVKDNKLLLTNIDHGLNLTNSSRSLYVGVCPKACTRFLLFRRLHPHSSEKDTDIDNVEMNKPIGYDRDTGAILTKVKIIVMKGTNKIITGDPS